MSVLEPIPVPETAAIQVETTDLVTRATSLAITDRDRELAGAEMLKAAKTIQASIAEEFAEPKKRAHEAHRSICALESKLLEPLKTAEQIIKRKLSDYAAEQERIRREEEQRLRELARREEEERRIAEALLLEDEGAADEAEAVLDAPVIAPVIAMPKPQRIDGISYRTIYRGEVTHPATFLAWLMEHPDRIREVIDFRSAGLNNLAKSIGSSVEVPGFRVTVEKSVASGRG